jgi:branched-chain amino acid transport system substrate-binding protein
MIGLPDWSDTNDLIALSQLKAADVVPEGYVLPGYAALQIAAASLMPEDPSQSFKSHIENTKFATAIGLVRFDDKGDMVGNPYRLYEWDGNAFVEAH